MRWTRCLVLVGIALATVPCSERPADAVELPDALIPQQRPAISDNYLFAQVDEVQFGGATRSIRNSSPDNRVEVVRSGRSGGDVVVSVEPPQTPAKSKFDGPTTSSERPSTSARTARKPVTHNPQSLASALFPVRVSTTNPYGEIDDTRGLRPYNPGVKYDRELDDDHDSSFFGKIFGR